MPKLSDIQQDGAPFPRDIRAIVYQRAKHELDKRLLISTEN